MPIKPVTPEPEHRVMWPNGPSRRFSEVRTTLTLLSYDLGGFVGNYVCQGCEVPCIGVYRLNVRDSYARNWICDHCKKAKPSRKVTGTPMGVAGVESLLQGAWSAVQVKACAGWMIASHF
jgi:hypothetical protein